MATIAVKFQNPRNNGALLAGFSLLAVCSQLVARTLSQNTYFSSISAQVMRALPVTSICEMVACWLPAGGQFLTWCRWINLAGTAIRLLCQAL